MQRALITIFAVLSASASALTIPAALTRRAACQTAAAALAGGLASSAAQAATVPAKEAQQLRDTSAALKALLENKESLVSALSTTPSEVKLPAPIPFTVFQKLEKTADPEFMEAAIDYAEGAFPAVPALLPSPCMRQTILRIFMDLSHSLSLSLPRLRTSAYRGVKDLVKLAKLTKDPVTVTKKEKGQPRQEQVMSYGDAPGSGLSSTEEYAKRAGDEILGASVALEAAIKYMGA